ncbi:VOC family protein [uncultured Sphingomonas sp.]|uniref:VOC family protein n=1 Tax=uncultured Sphingomonas sp. TaxID=158754 RepID=UPI0035CBB946
MTDPATPAVSFSFSFFKINVADLDAAVRFYTEVFGFSVTDTVSLPELEERMLVMPGAKFTLVLLQWQDGRAITVGNGFGPAGFLTRDVDAAYGRALAHGASAHRPPTGMGPMRVAFVLDPEGHEIEMIQYRRAA